MMYEMCALHGLAPEYISEVLELKTSSRYNLRSSNDKHLLGHLKIKAKLPWETAPLLLPYLSYGIIFLVLCGIL